jgi:hypothetical protein
MSPEWTPQVWRPQRDPTLVTSLFSEGFGDLTGALHEAEAQPGAANRISWWPIWFNPQEAVFSLVLAPQLPFHSA